MRLDCTKKNSANTFLSLSPGNDSDSQLGKSKVRLSDTSFFAHTKIAQFLRTQKARNGGLPALSDPGFVPYNIYLMRAAPRGVDQTLAIESA